MNDDTMIPDPMDVDKNKVMAVFAYLVCLCIVPLVVSKDSPYVRYHVNQGMVLLGCWVVCFVFSITPIGIIRFISYPLQLGLFLLMVLGVINAATGKMAPLPLIGGISIVK